MHYCTVCSRDSALHPAACLESACEGVPHWPALCCPGCECASYELAHGGVGTLSLENIEWQEPVTDYFMDDNSIGVTIGNPHNDQMLAQAREDFRKLLDITVHPLLQQGNEQNADMAAMMAVLVTGWLGRVDYMPRARLATLLALASFTIALDELEREMQSGESAQDHQDAGE